MAGGYSISIVAVIKVPLEGNDAAIGIRRIRGVKVALQSVAAVSERGNRGLVRRSCDRNGYGISIGCSIVIGDL